MDAKIAEIKTKILNQIDAKLDKKVSVSDLDKMVNILAKIPDTMGDWTKIMTQLLQKSEKDGKATKGGK